MYLIQATSGRTRSLSNGLATTASYDPSGNRLSKETQGKTPVTYTYNPTNQLTEDSLGNTYSYNSRGDMVKIEKGDYQRQYEFDGKGRLTGINDTEGMALDYTYDPADRTHTSKENGTTTTHAYDMNTDREIATLNQDLTLDTLFHTGADGLISSTTNSTTSYFTYNPHSDVSLLTDETGNTTSELHYDAWGNTAEDTDEPYTYLGKHQRPTYSTPGLIKMGARFYDPETGRFISRDPLEGYSGPDCLGHGLTIKVTSLPDSRPLPSCGNLTGMSRHLDSEGRSNGGRILKLRMSVRRRLGEC